MQSNTLVWLMRRGITNDVISDFGIHDGDHPKLKEAIVIPIKDIHGHVIFNKYRRNPADDAKPKYLYDAGAAVSLFGIHNLPDGPVVITEGELDALVLRSLNIASVSSTGGAMSWRPEWSEQFLGREVYICYDNDDAGADGAVRTLESLPHAKVIFIPEMPGVKDISDFVSRGGDFRALMDGAMQYPTREAVEEDMRKRDGMWLPTKFHRAWLDKHQERRETAYTPRTDLTDKVERARAYPIDKLIQFTGRKAVCPFHNEKTPSLQHYPKTNSAYCFGACGRRYDSIDVYRLKHPGKTFREAINDMI